MLCRATNLLVLFMLLMVIAAATFVALEIRHFWTEETDGPVDTEKLVSSENRNRQGYTSIAVSNASPRINQESIKQSAPSVHDLFYIAGSVRDTFGNPVQFAIVQLSSITADIQITTQSTVDGDFLLEQLQPVKDYQLNVKSEPRYVSFDTYNLALTKHVDNWDITLEYVSQTSLLGAIVDQLGNPVPALRLLAVSEEWSGSTVGISSDQSGKFILRNFIPGRITLRSASAPSFIVHGLALSPGESYYREFVVDIGSQQLYGMVTRDDGVPIPDVDMKMRFVQLHDDGYRSTTIRSAVTDTAGEFHFSGLGSGPRTLTFSAHGFKRHEIEMDPSLNPGPYSVALSSSSLPSAR